MTPQFTGRSVEWDREKGYGWLETQGQRIFLHIRDFAERHKPPELGDVIRLLVPREPKQSLVTGLTVQSRTFTASTRSDRR